MFAKVQVIWNRNIGRNIFWNFVVVFFVVEKDQNRALPWQPYGKNERTPPFTTSLKVLGLMDVVKSSSKKKKWKKLTLGIRPSPFRQDSTVNFSGGNFNSIQISIHTLWGIDQINEWLVSYLMGLIDPYTSGEHSFFKWYRVAYKGVNNVWR